MELSCRRIIELADKVMDGQEITRTEAMELIPQMQIRWSFWLWRIRSGRNLRGMGLTSVPLSMPEVAIVRKTAGSVHSPVSGIPEPGYTACFRKNRLWIWPGRPEMLVLFVFLL